MFYFFLTLTKVNSCQKSFELLPVFSNQALINQTSFISDISCEINKKIKLDYELWYRKSQRK